MAIKSIEAPIGVDLVREAAASAANSRRSQRPPVRSGDAPSTTANTSTNNANTQSAPGQDSAAVPPAPAPAPDMRIHVDQDTGKTIVSIVDPSTGQVLRQIPSKEALEVAKAIGKFQGRFVDLKV